TSASSGGGWLTSDALTVADITTVVAYDTVVARYLVKDYPYLNLKALSERANALPAFADSRFKRD
ncbi:MAG: hypothetical protein ACE5EU_14910, partial [Paracoccaceae bacterium]